MAAAFIERWEHFPHGADLGIRGIGPTPESAFAQAGLAMTAAIADLERVEPAEQLTVECGAPSLQELFFDWLDALVFEMNTRKMLFCRFDVRIQDGGLRANIWGEPIDRARHEPAIEVKGPTYTELCVARDPATGQWLAQCVVDV